MTETDAPSRQRIDKWLWCARFFKTRTLAARVVDSGGVRLTRSGQTQRVDKPSTSIAPGDRLSFLRGERQIIVEVVMTADRRGPAPEAATLYIDHSPPPPPRDSDDSAADSGMRDKGAGRPTKKDRRALDALKKLSG